MPNVPDSAHELLRGVATASKAEPEAAPTGGVGAPWRGRYPLNGYANGAKSNGFGTTLGERQPRGETALLRDKARTVLPVEYQGREIVFEAHAYEDDSASYQALALVHRAASPSSTSELPLVRVHS